MFGLHDAYLSVAEALRHAGYCNNTHVDIKWIVSEKITEKNQKNVLGDADGIIICQGKQYSLFRYMLGNANCSY